MTYCTGNMGTLSNEYRKHFRWQVCKFCGNLVVTYQTTQLQFILNLNFLLDNNIFQ